MYRASEHAKSRVSKGRGCGCGCLGAADGFGATTERVGGAVVGTAISFLQESVDAAERPEESPDDRRLAGPVVALHKE